MYTSNRRHLSPTAAPTDGGPGYVHNPSVLRTTVTASDMASIRVERLVKEYRTQKGGTYRALETLDFEVAKGEFVSVVGPSGCGKSTLMKVVAGLIPYSTGRVEINGAAVRGPDRSVGVVFQDPLLLEWRTVRQNVMLPIQVMRLSRETYAPRCEALLEMTGLARFADNYPRELSGGMQQRVAICRALVFDPEILLLDEPFGALDAMTRDYMNLELLKLWEQSGKTSVLITHSINEAVFLSDRVYVMSASPGTIRDIVHVDLPRPRTLSISGAPRFGEIVVRIRAHFDALFAEREKARVSGPTAEAAR
jgi:NitT/TauT family transport system ATP-binding protein